MTLNYSMIEKHLPKKSGNPNRLVVPIEAVEAWEKIGYSAIGNIVQFPGLQEGTFWKEVVNSKKQTMSVDENNCSTLSFDKMGLMQLIEEAQLQTSSALSYLHVTTAAIMASVTEVDCIRAYDLRLVLNSVVKYVRLVDQLISRIELVANKAQ